MRCPAALIFSRQSYSVCLLVVTFSTFIRLRGIKGTRSQSTVPRDLLVAVANRTSALVVTQGAVDDFAAASSPKQHSLIIASIHQGYGTHFINLHCGTPPQRQTLIIDTGSDVTGFVCQGCRRCGQQHNYFDPQQSSSYQELTCHQCLHGKCVKNLRNAPGQCRMEASYREGSGWKANEASDVCHVGDWELDRLRKRDRAISSKGNATQALDRNLIADNHHQRFPLKFACQTSVSGAFQSQLEDGIVGLEYSSASLWRQMYSTGAIQRQAFALCFGRSLKPSVDGSALAGVLTLGGYERRLHTSPMVFAQGADKSSKSDYFYVIVRKVYLREGGGGNSARSSDPALKIHQLDISEDDLNYEEVIIDSGATDTYFTKKLEAPFQKVWKQLTGERFDRQIRPKLTKEELDRLPTMLFQLRGDEENNRKTSKEDNQTLVTGLAGNLDPDNPFDVLVAVPPSYYYEYNPETGRYYSRFHFDPAYDSALGSSTMHGHDIFFDVANRRIGWAESSCDYEALVSDSLELSALARDVRSGRNKHTNVTSFISATLMEHGKGEEQKVSEISGRQKLANNETEAHIVSIAIASSCDSSSCNMLLLCYMLFGGGLLSWSMSRICVKRRRQRLSHTQVIKDTLSDDEEDEDEYASGPVKNYRGSLGNQSFDQMDGSDIIGGGEGLFRLHSITRRYRG